MGPRRRGRGLSAVALRRVISEPSHLLANAPINASLAGKNEWLEHLCLSIQHGDPVARLVGALAWLDANPDSKARTARLIRSVLRESSALKLFSDTGIPTEQGFLGEVVERFLAWSLPQPVSDRDLAHLLPRLFPHEKDEAWLERLPDGTWERLSAWIAFGLPGEVAGTGSGSQGVTQEPAPGALLRRELLDSLLLLSSYLCSIGLSELIRKRAPLRDVRESPFLGLHRACEALVERAENERGSESPEASDRRKAALAQHGRDGAQAGTQTVPPAYNGPRIETQASPWTDISAASERCHAEIQRCRDDLREVFAHLEESGLTIGLVYQLEKIDAHLGRIEAILKLLAPKDAVGRLIGRRPDLEAAFLAQLVAGARHDRSFSFVLANNLRRISRKVVERSGDAGEHYIAQNRKEYFQVLWGAAGGGALTAATTLVKYALGAVKLPLFFQAVFNSLNYSGSFILMQILGFRLATKQPSMTAAALAGRLRETRNMHEFESFMELVARITRSQFAAALGNLGAIIPVALAISWASEHYLHRVIFDEATAHHVVESLDPLGTLTLFYAALTGALLWISSAFASWVENWTVYRGVAEALSRSRRLHHWFGEKGARRAGEVFSHQILPTTSSITLGVLLAVVPMLGKFSGLPLDVRHVTLSTGALTFATASAERIPQHELVMASVGIAGVGILNFGVSFAISLFFAVRARGVDGRWLGMLFKATAKRALRRPLEFFFPVRD
jgi:site-specific recombinase